MEKQSIPKQFIYGGDYNPEQWLDRPDILARDLEMLQKARINAVTLGVFSWSILEPEEGVFHLEWLKEMMNTLYARGIRVILATPSGARPRWLAEKYPEVLRVREDRVRCLYGERHNHCYTSPVYRQKVQAINQKLAETFKDHPGVILWHISNEYGGECHCPLCQAAFRRWLKERYQTIDALNHAWWTAFWSHTYTSFEQVESPSTLGDSGLHGLSLDWKRFVTAQTTDFMREEIRALREAGATQPVTTNFMEDYTGLNYYELAKEIDIVSWDSYPLWRYQSDSRTALQTGMQHDLMRTMKHAPFLLMESSPSGLNWQPVSKMKKAGLLLNASLHAIAHGADSVQFFQIRQGRGGFEKFHGAVIDHYGGEDTRVFREVTQTGQALESLACIAGSQVDAPAAVLWDTESRWAMEQARGPRNEGLFYREAVFKSYQALRKCGLNVDLLQVEQPLEGYRMLVVPMLYMFRSGIEDRLREFVQGGGTLIMTYWSGIVNETDLCYLGGTPHGLTDLLGLRSEEIDALCTGEVHHFAAESGAPQYRCENLCDLVRLQGAQTLMRYTDDFYRGYPAVTVHPYGKGRAYYICTDAEEGFYNDFYKEVTACLNLAPILPSMPEGLEVSSRQDEENEYIFVQNFTDDPISLPVPPNAAVLFGDFEAGQVQGCSTVVFRRRRV